MAVKYLAGERIIGTAAERAALTTTQPATTTSFGWKEIDRVTITTDTNLVDTGVFTEKDHIMWLFHGVSQANNSMTNVYMWYNGVNSGSTYALTSKLNNASINTNVSQAKIRLIDDGGSDFEYFGYGFINNKSGEEKLGHHEILQSTSGTGATNSVIHGKYASKWATTNDIIDRITIQGGQDWAAGTELVILGCDDDETATTGANASPTHTDTPFWQELAANKTIVSNQLDSGAFTAKRYLWVEFDVHVSIYNDTGIGMRFNNDSTDTDYRFTRMENGGTPYHTNLNYINMTNSGSARQSGTAIIFAGASSGDFDKEKKYLINSMQTSTGSNTINSGNQSPRIYEVGGKWASTGDSLTAVNMIDVGNANVQTGSSIRVWGGN